MRRVVRSAGFVLLAAFEDFTNAFDRRSIASFFDPLFENRIRLLDREFVAENEPSENTDGAGEFDVTFCCEFTRRAVVGCERS